MTELLQPDTAAADATEPHEQEAAVEIAATSQPLLEHLNGEHGDTLAFVATVLAGVPAGAQVEALAIDADGIDVRVLGDDGTIVRIAFAEPVTEVDQLSIQAFGLITRARSIVGDALPLTSLEQEQVGLDAIPTLFTQVVRTEQRSPHLRRITFGGGDLRTFAPKSPDQFVYVLLPPAGMTEMSIDASFTWEQYRQMPPELQPRGAYYTVRHWRPDVCELDLDFVLHGDGGAASAWAARAQRGDKVALWGPRTAYDPPAGTDWYLLVGDETGLPGIGAILDALPHEAVARVIVEVADAAERQPLRELPGVEVTWIHRDGAPAGTTTSLADAVRSLRFPTGTPYAWGGAESRAITAVRTYLRNEVGLPRDAVSMVGYWRHAESPPSDG